MKFKEIRQKRLQRLKEYTTRDGKVLKPTSPKMRLQMAIAIALDMGGNMTGAYKKIEKIERGLGDHPAVKAALRYANESVNEKLSAADKKKRLLMIKKAVEKMKDRELKMAKKDALAAIKALESVEESVNELNGQTGPVLRISYKPQKIGGKLTSHSTITKSDLYNDVIYNKKNWSMTANTNSIEMRLPHAKGDERDRKTFMDLLSGASNTANLIRGGRFTKSEVMELKKDYEKAAKAFGADKVVSQDHSIYVSHKVPGKLKVKEGLLAMLKALDEFGMRNHISLNSRNGVLTQIQDAGQYGTNESVTEGKLDKVNLKLKELEYKMKLSDFRNKIKEYGHTVVKNKKKLPEADTSELKVSDTSSTTFNKLSKIAKDVGVEITRDENHLKIVGDAKKMQEFKSQMSIAMKESVLNEAYSKNLTDKDIDAQFKQFRDPEAFFGNLDKARADMKKDYSPKNSARPKVWTALRYPVRDGDYYFAFIDKNERKNMKYNDQLNDALKKAKVGGDKKSVDDMWLIASRELRTYPKSLGWNDTMTREEIYGAIQHLLGKISESKIIEKHISTKAGIMVGKRMKAPRYESVKESKKTFKEVRTMKRRDVMRKHGRELKKVISPSSNSFDLSDKAEEDLITYVMDNYPEEIPHDDPDLWLEWLEDNLEDFVKGRGYE